MTTFPAPNTAFIWFADPGTIVFGVFEEGQEDLSRFQSLTERSASMHNVINEIEARYPTVSIEMVESGDPILPVLDQYATEIRVNVYENPSSNSVHVD